MASAAPHPHCPLDSPSPYFKHAKRFTSFLQCGAHTVHSVQGEAAQCRAEQDKASPPPAGSAGPDELQGIVGLLSCQRALLTHVQLALKQNTQIPFCWAITASRPQSVCLARLTQSQVQNLAIALAKFHGTGGLHSPLICQDLSARLLYP